MIAAALSRTGGWRLAPVIDWLFGHGRFIADANQFTRELGERMIVAGAPVMRMRMMVRILHPLLTSWSAIWQADGRMERDILQPHGLEKRSVYIGSPLEQVYRTRKPFRRNIAAGLTDRDHLVLHEIAAEGGTDYLAMPLPLTKGRLSAITLVSGRAGGFDDDDIAKFEALAEALSPIVETFMVDRLAGVVASTYIGPRSGARVLDGAIKRGDIEQLRAAIWFSDIRGWSRLTRDLPPAEAVARANAYFETVENAIGEAGGEMLKLIGDAVLAIFPAAEGDRPACTAAIAAAHSAQRAAKTKPDHVGFGIGLHLGTVIYGNVGAPTRLDFTVMGEAVNFTARIEKLCRPLAQPIVVSAAVANAAGTACRDLGRHALAGWDEPAAVFAPEPIGQ
ncbi:MAG: adenylate/guanylate cyclase domain-containing protein [Alphaproteobacteria bacterium]|nr:adenylate/guanylate cyclase domain-containing protein [Alphaproteobacteria bacterium]